MSYMPELVLTPRWTEATLEPLLTRKLWAGLYLLPHVIRCLLENRDWLRWIIFYILEGDWKKKNNLFDRRLWESCLEEVRPEMILTF